MSNPLYQMMQGTVQGNMPDMMKKALPDVEELRKLLTDSTE